MSQPLAPEIVARFDELRRRVEESGATHGESTRRELLDFARAALGRDREETAVAEVDLAAWLVDSGRSADAVEMARHSMWVLGNSKADVGLWYARSLMVAGEALDKTGDDTAAMDYYRLAHGEFAHRAGEGYPAAIRAALNCAEVLRVAHDFEAAERWFRRVLAVEHAQGSQRSASVAHASNNLAETLLALGRADEAVPLADDALAIRSELFGPRSPDAARSRGVVALIAARRGDEERLQAAFDASREKPDSNTVTLPVEVIVAYLALKGRHADAVPMLESALARLDDPQGVHDDSAVPHERIALRFRLAELLRHLGRSREALTHMRDAFDLEVMRLSDEARVRSRRQMRNLLKDSRARLAEALRLLVAATDASEATEEDRREIYKVLQQRKALETRLLEMQKLSFITDRALTAAPPEVVERVKARVQRITASLHQARAASLSTLMTLVRAGGDDRADPELIALREHEESLERDLAGCVGERSYDWAVLGVKSDVPTPADNAAVVEYVLVESPEPSYFAFVVTRHGVQLAELGEAAPIDEAIRQLRSQVIDEPALADEREPRWRRRARFVSNRLLTPILPWLEGVEVLYVVPDGALFTLPFDLLPLDDGSCALERWQCSFLWNGGELNGKGFTFGSFDAPGKSVVVSAPDTALKIVRPDIDESDAPHAPAHRFATLPFADAEGRAITALIGAEQWSGARATKEGLLSVENPEILHLATHSFWIEEVARGESSDGDVGIERDTLLFRSRARLSDPLLRSAIALAGADGDLDAPTAASPGIAFASELLELDLRQTDLVVMSSCQSGIGDPSPGDGVQGLRRAFRAAGAESVVSSLWKVPDQATSELMQEFYTRLLAQQTRREALHEAKRAMFARYPTSPMRWAGFVLDGADGALFRFSPLRGLRIATLSGVGLSLDTAREHIEREEWDEALESLDFILESSTADTELRATAAYEKGGALRRSGRLAEALAVYDDMVGSPSTPVNLQQSAVADRALTKYLLNDFTGARLDYTAFLADESLSPDKRAYAFVNRAVVFERMGNRPRAIADCEAALSLPEVRESIRAMARNNLEALQAGGGVEKVDGDTTDSSP